MLPQRQFENFEQIQKPVKKLRQVKKRGNLRRQPLNRALRSHAQMAFLIISVLAMAVVVRSGISATRGYALVGTQQQVLNLEQENERLKVEIAQLKSPARIKQIAITELNMDIPKKMYFSHDR